MEEIQVSERLRSRYNDYYGAGDSEWRRLGAIDKARNIHALCKPLAIGSILEIGAGEGSVLQRLSELGVGEELFAVEISRTAVAAVERRRIQGLVECVWFDGYRIPYGERRFDLAVLSHVLEHVEHPRALLYEAGRVARYVFVEVPLEDTLRLPRDFVLDEVGHINSYSPKTIRRLIQSCDLEVIGERVTNPSKATYAFRMGRKGAFVFYAKEYLLRLIPAVATAIFTYHSAIVCRSADASV